MRVCRTLSPISCAALTLSSVPTCIHPPTHPGCLLHSARQWVADRTCMKMSVWMEEPILRPRRYEQPCNSPPPQRLESRPAEWWRVGGGGWRGHLYDADTQHSAANVVEDGVAHPDIHQLPCAAPPPHPQWAAGRGERQGAVEHL